MSPDELDPLITLLLLCPDEEDEVPSELEDEDECWEDVEFSVEELDDEWPEDGDDADTEVDVRPELEELELTSVVGNWCNCS